VAGRDVPAECLTDTRVDQTCRENGAVGVSYRPLLGSGLEWESWFEPACTIDTLSTGSH